MGRFVKKPVEVYAIQFNGDNHKECMEYIEGNFDPKLNYPHIITSEGVMRVNKWDFIIKEPFDKARKFYPCKPGIFKKTYMKVIEPTSEFKDWLPIEKVRWIRSGVLSGRFTENDGMLGDDLLTALGQLETQLKGK